MAPARCCERPFPDAPKSLHCNAGRVAAQPNSSQGFTLGRLHLPDQRPKGQRRAGVNTDKTPSCAGYPGCPGYPACTGTSRPPTASPRLGRSMIQSHLTNSPPKGPDAFVVNMYPQLPPGQSGKPGKPGCFFPGQLPIRKRPCWVACLHACMRYEVSAQTCLVGAALLAAAVSRPHL